MLTLQEKAVCQAKLETDFLFFTRYFFKKRYKNNFIVNEHHIQIVEALTRVYNGECKRLVINIPPRYGKTELAVINFIAWCLARNPKSKFIHLSYSDDLVLDNSSKIKEMVLSDDFQSFWPLSLKIDSKSKKKWYTEEGGGLYATPTGGAVTGFGAGSTAGEDFCGAIIIDDPVKSSDVKSETILNTINDRLNNTIMSRLNSRETPIILIMQRLHDVDMTGYVLGGGTGEDWERLNLPVIKKSGEALWPHKHTLEELETIRRADKYTFSGQYMQEPIPDDGIYFSKTEFNWYENLPAHLNFYGASDYAVTEGGGDFTEHGVFGVCPSGNVYLTDWWGGQKKADVWIENQLDLVAKYRPFEWVGETGPIKAAVEPWLLRRMNERRTYTKLTWLSHSHNNKEANARTFQALVSSGRVYLPKDKQWAIDLLSQLTRFPLAVHDDKVDVCSLFARRISDIWLSEPSQHNKEDKFDDYTFDDEGDDESWKIA